MKDIALIFTRILYILVAIGTIILLLMAYKVIEISIDFKFIIGYMLLAFLLLFHVAIITILNLRKLKWVQIRKRLFKFIALFIFFSTLYYISDCFFKQSNIDLFRVFSSAIVSAFGISFIDVTLFKKRELD